MESISDILQVPWPMLGGWNQQEVFWSHGWQVEDGTDYGRYNPWGVRAGQSIRKLYYLIFSYPSCLHLVLYYKSLEEKHKKFYFCITLIQLIWYTVGVQQSCTKCIDACIMELTPKLSLELRFLLDKLGREGLGWFFNNKLWYTGAFLKTW